jgi:hypothetical protein
MIATETVKTVLLVLLGLTLLWIVIIIVKNDTQTIVRAILVAAVVGLGLYLVSQPGASVDGKISFTTIRDHLFPVPERAYTFERRDGHSAGRATTTYIFYDPGPPLSLAMLEGGKYMAIRDIRRVNAALKAVGLPPVTAAVSELASLTGLTLDADKFRWDDYERGVLLIERGICHDMATAQSFPCVSTIRITAR